MNMRKYIVVTVLVGVFINFSGLLNSVGHDGVVVPFRFVEIVGNYYYGMDFEDGTDYQREWRNLPQIEIKNKWFYRELSSLFYLVPKRVFKQFVAHVRKDVSENGIEGFEVFLEMAIEFNYHDLFELLLPFSSFREYLNDETLQLIASSNCLLPILLEYKNQDVESGLHGSDFFLKAAPYPENIEYILGSDFFSDDYLNAAFYQQFAWGGQTIIHAVVTAFSYLQEVSLFDQNREIFRNIVRKRQLESLRLILDSDRIGLAALQAHDNLGNNAFHLVDHPDVMKMLIESRMYSKTLFNERNHAGKTPLEAVFNRFQQAKRNHDCEEYKNLVKVIMLFITSPDLDFSIQSEGVKNSIGAFRENVRQLFLNELLCDT